MAYDLPRAQRHITDLIRLDENRAVYAYTKKPRYICSGALCINLSAVSLLLHGVHALDMLQAATAVTKTTGLTNTIAEVVELRATSVTTTNNLELRDQRRVHGPCTLNAYVTNHATHGDVLVDATTLTRDQDPREDLDTLLIAFDDTDMHIHCVADVKARNIILELICVDRFDNLLVAHGTHPYTRPVRDLRAGTATIGPSPPLVDPHKALKNTILRLQAPSAPRYTLCL